MTIDIDGDSHLDAYELGEFLKKDKDVCRRVNFTWKPCHILRAHWFFGKNIKPVALCVYTLVGTCWFMTGERSEECPTYIWCRWRRYCFYDSAMISLIDTFALICASFVCKWCWKSRPSITHYALYTLETVDMQEFVKLMNGMRERRLKKHQQVWFIS